MGIAGRTAWLLDSMCMPRASNQGSGSGAYLATKPVLVPQPLTNRLTRSLSLVAAFGHFFRAGGVTNQQVLDMEGALRRS